MTSNRPSIKPVMLGVCGILCLFIGLGSLLLTVRGIYHRALSGQYVNAQFEIVRYHTETRRSSDDICQIEGIVRPQNVAVSVSDIDVDLTRIGDATGLLRMRPSREEVEGRTIPVRYWTGKHNPQAWLTPPLVTNAPVPSPTTLTWRALLTTALLAGAVACLQTVWRLEWRARRPRQQDRFKRESSRP